MRTTDKYCDMEDYECDLEQTPNPYFMAHFSSSYRPEELWRDETCEMVMLEAFEDSELTVPYSESEESPVTVEIDNTVVPPAVKFTISEDATEGFRSEIWFKGSTLSGAFSSVAVPVVRCG